MKTKYLITVVFLIFCYLARLESQAIGAPVFSNPVENICIGIVGTGGLNFNSVDLAINDNCIQYDEKMAMMVYCSTGAVRMVAPVNKVYFVKFDLFDSKGRPVKKTKEGELWGSDFAQFPEQAGNDQQNRIFSFASLPFSDKNRTNMAAIPYSLPSIKQLFTVEKNGVYKLAVEIHFMKQVLLPGDPREWTWKRLTIPPFIAKVEVSSNVVNFNESIKNKDK